ncbi:MAG: methyltransferase domain-containing protein [Solirubrobacterales bacterium]
MRDSLRWSDLASQQIPATLSWDPSFLTSLSGADVLDLGCGPRPSFEGLEHFSGRRVGVDSNLAALQAARDAVPDASFIQGDATSLPFPDAGFDLVLCKALLTALVYDETCERALGEAARVLRPAGVLLVADFLLNETDAYFTDRYRGGKSIGLPAGAFEVKDGDGEVLYIARHFAPGWIGEWAGRTPAFKLESYEERPVTTRSGRSTHGFIASLRRTGGEPSPGS